MQLIPAIDLIGGQVVRLSKGDYNQVEVYPGAPIDWLKRMEDAGLTRVHVVDLEGARTGKPIQANLIQTLAEQTSLAIDVGGGIRNRETVATYLQAGARWVSLGTSILTQTTEVQSWIQDFGAEHFLLGADIKDGFLAMQGWLAQSKLTLHEGLQPFWDLGVLGVICTDISKDGMLSGPAFDLYENCLRAHPEVAWTASGGITSENQLEQLHHMGLNGAIIGKALYTGAITLSAIAKLQKKWSNAN
jgi:phosphoribosylformimino-5-aminoimidazole carboxamide ribotide isomerase